MQYLGLGHKGTEIAMQIACTLFVLVCGWLLMKWHGRKEAAARSVRGVAAIAPARRVDQIA